MSVWFHILWNTMRHQLDSVVITTGKAEQRFFRFSVQSRMFKKMARGERKCIAEDTSITYPFETLKHSYVTPFGGRSIDLSVGLQDILSPKVR